jgi:TolA-binding protein
MNHLISLFFCALIFTVGCSQKQSQNASVDTSQDKQLVQETVSAEETFVQADEPQISGADAETESVNEEAAQKIKFANQYMEMAQKGLISYSQAVAVCRDVIKKYPDTVYQQQARALLGIVPAEERSQYNITDEELGL